MHVQGKFVHPITIQQSIEQNLEKEEYSPEKDFFQFRYIQVIQGGRHTHTNTSKTNEDRKKYA